MIGKENRLRSESGFTLIEAILSLLVLGIMGAVVGFGFSIMAQVYINNTNMVTVTTKTEVAMERLRKEFLHIASVNATTYDPVTTNASITFTNASELIPHTLAYVVVQAVGGETIRYLTFDSHKLLDEIQDFSLKYYSDYTDTIGTTSWDATRRLIGINLTMEQVGSATSAFNYETRVMPRNL